jgi:aminomethyltransferase
MSEILKNTALTKVLESLGAKMVPFAGYNMPVQYKGLIEEHHCVRKALGVFDVSHMGEFWVKGPKALDLIQKVTSNDASKLFDGKVQYSCLPNKDGGIVDDLLVYRFGEEEYFLVVNASNIEKDWNWIQQFNQEIGAEMTNVSDDYSVLAIHGPLAWKAMQKLTDMNVVDMEYYTVQRGKFAGKDNIIFATTGFHVITVVDEFGNEIRRKVQFESE